jgi:hypothetical protein
MDTGRHDTDHGRRRVRPADAHRLADDLRIAVELPLPKLVAEDDYPRRPGSRFRLHEGASHHGLQPRHAEIVFGDDHSLD